MGEKHFCTLCGEPMQPGEEMFKFHGSLGPCPKPPLPRKLTALEEIAAERDEQIAVHDYSASHDDMATARQLALAATAYAQAAACAQFETASSLPPPRYWPWEAVYWKPKTARENLIKAGALIVAEIERLDRKAARK